jgi:F-type H+-transporting ATPase subunit delta
MKNILLARRYALAIFAFALENNEIDRLSADMKMIGNVMSENTELQHLMVSPVVSNVRKKIILRKIFEDHIHKLTLTFLDILVRKGREREIREIAIQFDKIYLDYKKITRVELTTATAIEPATQQRMMSSFEDKTHNTLQLEEQVDPDIIGGFVLKFDDYLYDASIRKTLSKLRKEFDKNLFKVGF